MFKSSWNLFLTRWEIVLASMFYIASIAAVCIFSYRAGFDTGFDAAHVNDSARVVKFPVERNSAVKLDPDKVSEVYARLSEQNSQNPIPEVQPSVEVASIKTLEEAPLDLPSTSPSPAFVSEYLRFSFTRGFYVEALLSDNMTSAHELADKLHKLGFPVYIQAIDGSKYRVLVGPETKETYAQRLISQLSQEKILPSKPELIEVK